ncbi:MAG: efflux RND transporter permease subunit [Beijerinckiaceae bacterium]
MQLSDISIQRPVFATVLSLLLLVGGFAALSGLPVREYPAIDPPIVSVNTVYRGAANEVIENRITEIVEGAIAGIEGIKQISSQSQNGRSSVSIEFNVGRDPDAAAADVRDRVGRILSRLPEGVQTPVVQRVDANAFSMMWIGVTSSEMSPLEITDYLRRNVIDRLSTVPGVANATINGERRYSMRVYLDRTALAARNLTALDVETAIKRQNVELPSGILTSQQREATIKLESRISSREEFEALVVSNRNGYPIRLGEVARVEIGAQDDRFEFFSQGRQGLGVGIIRQGTANTLSVAEGVLKELENLKPTLPSGMTMDVLYNEGVFIRASINGVLTTLIEGVALVVLVILLFLRDWRSTLVAVVAIPFSVIPTFMVLWALGFSINTLTLLAIVLAIGIVVDDAIVEVENIHRRIEEGEKPLLASSIGAREIAFAVIATTITLMSVFLPIAFMDGQTGKLFREFGITLAAAIGFSGLVARTLTPMMCSKMLSAHHSFIHRWTEPFFTGMNRFYRLLLRGSLGAPFVVLVVGAIISFMAYGFFNNIQKEFAPTEDRSTIFVPITAPEGSSLSYTRDRVKEVEAILKTYQDRGIVASTLSIVAPGFQRPAPVNAGLLIVRMKPWDERSMGQIQLQRELLGRLQAVTGARVFAVNPPSLGQRGATNQPVQFVLGGPDYETIKGWRNALIQRAQQTGKILNLDSDFREAQPDLRVRIDRARAADLGVSVEAIGRTLELMFGEREVSQYVDRGVEYAIIMQARAEDRNGPSDLKNVFVRTGSGTTVGNFGANSEMVPLSNFVSLTEVAGPQGLNRLDRIRSITIQGTPAPGVSLGEALTVLEQAAKEVLPPDVKIGYNGQSKEFKQTSSSIYVTFGVALLVVFLVLAAQFESWVAPITIMLAVPLALTGGLAALLMTGQTLNVYSQIGMILLIGIMTKNGILIVEFTNQLREEGKGLHEAVLEASVTRLRPILMTSIATVLGAVPLMISTGAGAESRQAIGTVIVGGVSLSTIFTLFIVPCLYLLIGGFTKPRNFIAEELERQEQEVAGAGNIGHGKPVQHPAE